MRFGEPLDDERFISLITPDESIRDRDHRRRVRDRRGRPDARPRRSRAAPRERDVRRRRRRPRLLHRRARRRRRASRASPIRGCADASELRRTTCGWRPSAASSAAGSTASTCCCCTTPTASATRARPSGTGWRRCATPGSTRMIGVAPGPANGFTLDVIDCLERFGELIDWAMIILNPLEPWPGELCLGAAATARREGDHPRRRLRRPVLRRRAARPGAAPHDHRSFRPAGWIEAGRERLDAMRPIAERAGLTMIQLACQWNLAHEAVACVVPTLIQEVGRRRPAGRGQARRARRAARGAAALRRGRRRDPRDRRQHRLHGAEGRQPRRTRATRRPGPLGAATSGSRTSRGAGGSSPSATSSRSRVWHWQPRTGIRVTMSVRALTGGCGMRRRRAYELDASRS